MKSKQQRANEVLSKLTELYPDAGTRLKYSTRFELLVAVMLSARSTDDQVNQVTAELFQRYNRPEQFARLAPDELEPLIRGCGLYRNKARHIIDMSRRLMEDFGGEIPDELDLLTRLPGVGSKTANVVLSVGFGLPGLAVDTHVQRVTSRLGWHESKNPEVTEKILKSLLPSAQWSSAHHLLIAHGRAVCRARRPDCARCGIARFCSTGEEMGYGTDETKELGE